jgi:hypothetical protein
MWLRAGRSGEQASAMTPLLALGPWLLVACHPSWLVTCAPRTQCHAPCFMLRCLLCGSVAFPQG